MDSTYKVITTKDKLHQLTKKTVEEIVDVVTDTMGPYGNTVWLTRIGIPPKATKDGVSVMKNLWSDDAIKNQIIQVVKETAENTLKVAGDGTTTAICLLGALIKIGFVMS